MADIAALQLPTMPPPFFPASFPTSPDSPQRAQLPWRCSDSSVSVQRETFQNRRALSQITQGLLMTHVVFGRAGLINSGKVSLKVQCQ